MTFYRYKLFYIRFIPTFVLPSIILNTYIGLKNNTPNCYYKKLANVLGYTTLGLGLGIGYPLTVPLLCGTIIYKLNK